jgi:hypothetical protein
VFGSGADPVDTGLVTSMNRPGSNVTGATFLTALLGAKRLGLLRDLVPDAQVVALLVNPNTTVGRLQTRDVQEAARELGQSLVVLDGGSDDLLLPQALPRGLPNAKGSHASRRSRQEHASAATVDRRRVGEQRAGVVSPRGNT